MGARECIACGCPLSAGDRCCPLCGASVPAHAAPVATAKAGAGEVDGADVAASGAAAVGAAQVRDAAAVMQALRKRPAILVAAGAAAVVLAVALCIAAFAVGGSSAVPENGGADGAAAGAGAAGSGLAAHEAASASVPGGGTVLADSAGAYLALDDGVYRCDDLSAYSETALLSKIAEGRAACLNRWGEGLCFLSGDAAATDPFSGTCVCTAALAGADGRQGSTQPSVQYEADDGASLSSLVVADGAACFLEDDGGQVRALRLADDGAEPHVVGAWEAERAWLFAESGQLYVATTAGGSWRLETADAAALGGMATEGVDDEADSADEGTGADDEGAAQTAAFSLVMEGEGALSAACFADGTFYCARGTGQTGLAARTAQGGFAEYPDVQDAVRIVASGDAVAAVTCEGGLAWVDTATGLTMDKSALAKELLPDARANETGLGLAGEWLVATDGDGAFLACSRADGTAFGGGADDAVDNADAA